MTGPQSPYGSPQQEGGESSQEFGDAGWFGQDRQNRPGLDDRDETVRTSAPQRPSDQGRHARPGYPAASSPTPAAHAPTSVEGPDATQVISSALEQPAPFQPAQPSQPVSEPESAETYGDATQVVHMSSPPSDRDDDHDQDDRFNSDATQVVSPGSMPPPTHSGPATPGGPRTGPGGFPPPGPPQQGGYPQPGRGGPGAGQPGWQQGEQQYYGQPGPFGGGPEEPQQRPYGAPGQPPPQAPPPGYGGPRPGQAPPPWTGPQPQQPMSPPPQQGWGGPPPGQQWGGGQQQYGAPPQQQYGAPQQQYGAPQPPWGGQPYGQQPGYPGYGQPAISLDRLADWPKRAIGGLIDFIGPSIIAIIFYYIAIGAESATLLLLSAVVWLGAVGFALYNAYLGGTTGQSIGKKYAKIRLVKEQTGDVIGGGMGIARGLLHVLDYLPCFIGFLAPLFTPKKQTFADMIVSTVVVKVD
jgi:uncharacterized RDD family membrane protein YckC